MTNSQTHYCREVVQTAHLVLWMVLNDTIRLLTNELPISRCQLDLKHAENLKQEGISLEKTGMLLDAAVTVFWRWLLKNEKFIKNS